MTGVSVVRALPHHAQTQVLDVDVAEIEVYAGAAHGWCPPDSQVYNEKQAERAWSRMLALFGKSLA